MLLADLLSAYLLERGVSPASAKHPRQTVRRFSEWLGYPATIFDLTADNLNRWIEVRLPTCTAKFVRNQRADLIALWRMAFERGLLPEPPRRVRVVKVPVRTPEAWSLADLGKLLIACDQLAGSFHNRLAVPRGPLLRAYVLAKYDTALRENDLQSLRRGDISPAGTFTVTQRKTGWPIHCRLRPETIAAIDATFPPQREFIFRVVSRDNSWRDAWQVVVKHAGLTGDTRKLRRTSATWVEATCPGSAMRHLGHRTPGLAYRHYIDPRHLPFDRPLPPGIAG